jgi:hypothetical protein
MSQSNSIMVRRGDIFINFELLGPNTSDILVINVNTISRMGVRPGRTTCVDVRRANH